MAGKATVRQSMDVTLPRPFCWRLGATATLGAARKHHWRATKDNGGAPWIGRDWNGRSDIKLGSKAVAADAVTSLVEELRIGIGAQNVRVAKLPDHKSVRTCSNGGPRPPSLVVDVDFGEFVLPVGFNGDLLINRPDITFAEIEAGMMKLVAETHAERHQVAALELELRSAFLEQTMLAGVIPLWLRMIPWQFYTRYQGPRSDLREMAVLMLDEDLRPVIRIRLTRTVADIQLYLGFHGEVQRRRSAMRSKLDAACSGGFVSEVALGLIKARGMDPIDVLNRLWAARLDQDHDGIVHRTATTRETLTLVEGVVEATIAFDGGCYTSGKLTLDGDYPRTLAMSAKRRPLTAFVDHPAFRVAGVTIRQARALRGRLRLYHTVRTMPMEEAACALARRVEAADADSSG
ncbi:MAG: hypothetical protein EOP62_11595 [Sphingomonadales bacterium]|nr:MAG: hypothetical protein EOP62_11595 [Sphingomonadales bacterium]